MKPSIRPLTQAARVAVCAVLLNFSVPGGAIVGFGVPLKEATLKALVARAAAVRDLAKRRAKSASRLLTGGEEATMQGRTGENPYLAGQSKWDVVYKGVDVMTGNYTTTATDLSFDGGYGIPVNVTRSYSANQADEGPFGKGWTLSADVRSTAGGLVKSGSSPVRSIPTTLKERAASEDDPNVAVEPAQAITATDAGGTEETVQKDVDGILTTPAWDKNVYDSVYDWVTLNGQSYQVLVSNTVKTSEGTVYTYAVKGRYPYGTVPWNSPGAPATAANILKVTSATDRQGNLTTYTYGANDVSFQKSNGLTLEKPLTGVAMPGGHHLTFVWGTSGDAANRIVSVSDNATDARVAHYTYRPGGLLWTATTPGGKTTTYGYGSPWVRSGWQGEVATNLLISVTDPRGLVTGIEYAMTEVSNNGSTYIPGAAAYRVLLPSGQSAFIGYGSFIPGTSGNNAPQAPPDASWPVRAPAQDHSCVLTVGDRTGQKLEDFIALTGVSSGMMFVGTGVNGIDVGQGGSSTYPFVSQKTYDVASENLMDEVTSTYRGRTDDLRAARGMNGAAYGRQSVETAKTYNFMGAPLSATVTESQTSVSYPFGTSVTRTANVAYAYWGASRYYQQKAVRDQAGRYSFTDYYPSTEVAGRRGQTFRVYDPKNAAFTTTADAGHPAPPIANGQSQSDYDAKLWKYTLHPASDLNYSAQFDYDPQGRPIEVRKLQQTTVSPWTYVVTKTEYAGGDGAPTWGQATKVTEDFGGINRVTQTNGYTSWGKADDVTDPAGREFVTGFDKDGLVSSVTRIDVTPNVPVVSYAYGTSGVENGQPLSVTDGLSGVVQTVSYAASGGGVGMPSGVSETNGSDAYSVSYGYSAAGDRATATYQTPQGTTKWGYSDYLPVGATGGRAFQTLARLDTGGDPTAEEMHYSYDSAGRLAQAAFAQSPAVVNGQTYVPPAHASYYAGHPASTRAISLYAYDAGGRLTSVATNEDTLNGNHYDETGLFQNACAYETSGVNRGLKTSSAFTLRNDDGSYDQRTQTYGYDSALDYLTSASYGDGNPNQTPTWAYDAAGNRSDAAVDSLNRATSVGGVACANDVLGNRLSKGATLYEWDCLSRMTALHGDVEATYQYRADGMRVAKAVGLSDHSPVTLYRHDGQMGVEDVESSGLPTARQVTVTRYGLGARGVDLIERTSPSGVVTTGFPIYDAHGNNVVTLSRNGSGGFALADRRTYDAWGVVRSQQSGGDPKLRYCASLGHRQDDESALVYMRARYYEPTSGRFVSEDPNRQGLNCFVYCLNDPVNKCDESGRDAVDVLKALLQAFLFIGGEILLGTWTDAANQVYRLTTWIAQTEEMLNLSNQASGTVRELADLRKELNEAKDTLSRAKGIRAGQALLKVIGYMMIVKTFLLDIDYVDERSGLDIIMGN